VSQLVRALAKDEDSEEEEEEEGAHAQPLAAALLRCGRGAA
jgi:hypothetical protein